MNEGRVLRAFALNLDAEVELASRGPYRASRALEAVLRDVRPRAARALFEAGDLAIDELFERGERLPEELLGLPGRAWCPTPSALARLRAVGAEPEPAPHVAILRRANGRRFSAELGQKLPGARLCCAAPEVWETLAADPARTFLAKRDLSAAGRGRRPLRARDLSPEDRAWVAAALLVGPLQVEPRVALEAEFGSHGWLEADGGLRLGEPTLQEIGPEGAWRASRPARPEDLDAGERGALLAELERVGRALHALGYFGPFGVDAYRWRDDAGARHLCTRGEVNARYSMGWRTGLGSRSGQGIG